MSMALSRDRIAVLSAPLSLGVQGCVELVSKPIMQLRKSSNDLCGFHPTKNIHTSYTLSRDASSGDK